MRDDNQRFLDILEAIEKIERHTAAGRKGFDESDLIQVWVLHHLQVIGEAASNLSDAARDKHPDVAWRNIIGMRNILVHGYFGIDVDIVWKVANEDLPPLKRTISGQRS